MQYFLDLFAGIGGFALGAYWAGLRFDRHFFSEVDPYAIDVYSHRFPDAEPLGDIRGIRGANLPAGEWIIAGGFPCQDISVAGKGAGLAGARSGLWYEYARLIGELRPRYAIMENVGALAFRGLDSVLGSLAALGYDAEWQDIRASDVGAPHRRERLWIVAYPNKERGNGAGRARDGRLESKDGGNMADALCESSAEGRKQSMGRSSLQAARSSECGETLADADSDRLHRAERNAPIEGGNREDDGIPFRGSSWWSAEPDVGRVAHGIPARVDRLKCLGNSIVPQIAELIFSQTIFDKWRIKDE